NYYPILGGSDFGINYNCAADCFNEPNLADEIEAAGETWAGYEQNGGGYSTPTDQLPFLAFSDIYNNPARVQAHLLPLTQLAPDLAQAATTPNFAWIAADEANNMEGPITGFGAVQFVLSQLGDHQYNIAAGDTFLQDTVTTILNSPVWQDPTQKSAIFITWDEDYNNLSLGNGNQGNHVVMIVIPSPGAVAAGMRSGEFVADAYYNHYSLERTIEDALGLPPLTDNDKYAQPMNEFWT
ncbi:MAG: phosphoesterase, partial [Mycolicibacterium sp.]|nr:phosphoesterase [Mycolicibacterium sp.]